MLRSRNVAKTASVPQEPQALPDILQGAVEAPVSTARPMGLRGATAPATFDPVRTLGGDGPKDFNWALTLDGRLEGHPLREAAKAALDQGGTEPCIKVMEAFIQDPPFHSPELLAALRLTVDAWRAGTGGDRQKLQDHGLAFPFATRLEDLFESVGHYDTRAGSGPNGIFSNYMEVLAEAKRGPALSVVPNAQAAAALAADMRTDVGERSIHFRATRWDASVTLITARCDETLANRWLAVIATDSVPGLHATPKTQEPT